MSAFLSMLSSAFLVEFTIQDNAFLAQVKYFLNHYFQLRSVDFTHRFSNIEAQDRIVYSLFERVERHRLINLQNPPLIQ